MKKRRVIAAAAVCLMLTGCSGLGLNSAELLTPPKAQGNQAQIQELIQHNAPNGYEMIYPEEGDYKSSVIFYDLDGDNDEDAVAMYSPDKENIKILIAENNGFNYTMKSECSVFTPRLNRVEFADLNGDGTSEIVVSYPGTPAMQSMTVISIGGDAAQTDLVNLCAEHLIRDFDGNGKNDLLTIAIADGENLPTARLWVDNGGSLYEQSSCEVASDVREYISLSFGKLSDEVSGAVIDAKCADGEYSTQLLCYDYNARGIVNPLYVSSSYQKTKRDAAVTSADIDRDGKIEIPVCHMMEYAQNEESSSVCDRIDWSSYDYSQLSLEVKQSAILCDRLGFLLNLTPEHADIVTARYIGENAAAVYLWEYKRNTPERTSRLLTIKRYEKSAYDKDTVLEAVAGQNSDYVYTYVIDSVEGFYGYTDDEVINNFVLIEDQIKS